MYTVRRKATRKGHPQTTSLHNTVCTDHDVASPGLLLCFWTANETEQVLNTRRNALALILVPFTFLLLRTD
jgi:hypothetical protein